MSSSDSPFRPPLALLLCACSSIAACSSSPVQWSSVAPYAPNTQATAIGVNGDGAAWFFQCDQQNVMTGLRIPKLQGAEGSAREVSIAFDNEPRQSATWNVEQSALVLRGEPARLLSQRAAVAYHAVLTVDDRPIRFALTGSHLAMFELMPACPHLEIP